MKKNTELAFFSENILDSIGDGVYVTDLDRNIVYWNNAAERITGWSRQDVVGSSCRDGILNHVDKTNRPLCGKDTCPLHRAISTGEASFSPVIIYARNSKGNRLPVEVNVAPIKNKAGRIIGGVEVFRDVSGKINDLERAKKIQKMALKWNIQKDSKLHASVHYTPYDLIGGDYYALEQLSDTQYVFLLADVMGHGISAALHTMYLRSLWEGYFGLFPDVAGFMKAMNQQLYQLMQGNVSFAAAVCGMIDLDQQIVTLAGGAFPGPFLFKKNAANKRIKIPGFALGMVKNTDYPVQTFDFNPGDILFVYTDGAVENPDPHGKLLGEKALMAILQGLGYPENHFMHTQIEELILKHTANIVLKDDLTFIEFQYR